MGKYTSSRNSPAPYVVWRQLQRAPQMMLCDARAKASRWRARARASEQASKQARHCQEELECSSRAIAGLPEDILAPGAPNPGAAKGNGKHEEAARVGGAYPKPAPKRGNACSAPCCPPRPNTVTMCGARRKFPCFECFRGVKI
jgi:hypothetical protein